MLLLYDIILTLALVILLPLAVFKGAALGLLREGVRERLGLYSSAQLAAFSGRRVLWVHAVSVGEARASVPLLRELRRAFPDAAIVLSGVTFTGRKIAEQLAEVDLCIFLPYDLPWLVRRALRALDPAAVLLVETELWPNFLRELGRRGTPVVLANGRISDRSYPRYRQVKGLLGPLLGNITRFCMQTETDAERISALGAAHERIKVVGNLKFDMTPALMDTAEQARLRTSLGLPESVPLLVAGSTHPGEEEVLVAAYARLVAGGTPLILLMVPRHPERSRQVGEMLQKRGHRVVYRSGKADGDGPLVPGDVLVVNTLGELPAFYGLADVAYVGGSLVPVGGHNPLEPALMARPVMFGPRMENAREAARLLVEAGAALEVEGAAGVEQAVASLLADPARRREMGEQGRELFSVHAGATLKTVQVLQELVG